MNTRKVRMTIVLVGMLVYIIINYKSIYAYWFKGKICSLEMEAKEIELNGLVIDKFYDSDNHNLKTIKVRNNGRIDKVYLIDNEDSLLWAKVNVNDSIKKAENSLIYYLKSVNKRDTIKIKYNCKN
jgi:hypothetical protein